MRNYNKSYLKGDLSAGLTVGVMLIPQGMAYAMLAGLPPIYGLYASTVPLIIYALLGTSRQLAVGPVAMVSLLTASGVGLLATGGTEEFIGLAILLALMVGLIQFILGASRLGFLVNFLSHPVISGFTSAAALIIGLSQLKYLLGVPIERSHHVHEIIISAARQLGDINWPTLAIGLGGMALILGARRVHKLIPGPLLAVLFGILVVWLANLEGAGVNIVGNVPGGLPSFTLPSFDWDQWQALLPTALAIALVSFMESIAVAKAIQNKHKDYKIDPNQELLALGSANILGSFFQSYPTTGGFSRTAVNDQAGAKTGMASIISALLIVLTLLFLTSLFYFLPKAILASVIMVAVFGLIDYKEAIRLWKVHRGDFWMLIITFIATLALGIEQGIGLGVLLSIGMIIFRSTRPHIAELGQIEGTHHYRNIHRFDNVKVRDNILIVRFDASLYFANIEHFQETINSWIESKGTALKAVVLNFESVNNLDSSALHGLKSLDTGLRKDGVIVVYTGIKGPVRDRMDKAGLTDKIGEQYFFLSVQEAIDRIENPGNDDRQKAFMPYTLQHND
jgi:SulP family sulfate permease